jgi:hypothetical protein
MRQKNMRIYAITTAARQAEFGDRRVAVEWRDGSRSEEAIPGTVPVNRFAEWLERKRGGKLRCWRRL